MFFSFFQIVIFRVVRGVKEQKMSKMTKTFVCCTWYLWNHTWYDKMIISPGNFFFKIFIFWVVGVAGGVKGQKMAQNVENFSLLHLIF